MDRYPHDDDTGPGAGSADDPGGTFGIYGAGNSIYCPAHRDLLHSTSHVPCKSFCGRAFGGGDIRLLAAAGFCLGWKTCLIGTITGLFLGGLQSVVLLALGKVRFGERARIPFAPALCMGLFAARLFEDQIVSLFFWGTW